MSTVYSIRGDAAFLAILKSSRKTKITDVGEEVPVRRRTARMTHPVLQDTSAGSPLFLPNLDAKLVPREKARVLATADNENHETGKGDGERERER